MKLGRGQGKALLVGAMGLLSFAALLSPSVWAQTYLYNQATFATGNSPAAVITADFNGDGRLDLAVVNQADNTVSILLGKTDGTFQQQVTYPTGASPNAIFAADFNGDGHLDLAITDSQANTVSILLGNGDGTFQPKVDFAVGNDPYALVAADFNGDKNIDLAVANNNDGTVSILLGNGNGTFQSPSTVTVGQSPESIVSADFNADGKPDLAVANYRGGSVSVLLGNGDGTFNASTVSVIPNPFSLLAGDFNNDGKVDLLTPDEYTGQLDLLLGNGDGTFQTPIAVNLAPYVTAVAAADFNHDGFLDLAVTQNEGGQNRLITLLGNGNGTFQPTINGPADGSPLALGDVNGDGQTDVIFCNGLSASASVLLGNSNGTFSTLSSIPLVSTAGIGVGASGDFNGDGKADLVVAQSGSPTGLLSVLLGNGNGTFQSAVSTATETAAALAMVAGDFNGDGKTDVGVANSNASTISVFLSNSSGNGTFQPPVDTIYSLTFVAFAAGHFEGTANPLDLAVTTTDPATNSNFVNIYLGNGSGGFTVGPQYPIASNITPLIVSSDFNGDGYADLAVTDGSQILVYLSKGDGTFQSAVAYPVPSSGNSIVLGDFNGDGVTDIAVGETNGVAVLLGNGNGTFQTAVSTPYNPGMTLAQAGDFNGDGKMDLVGRNSSGNYVFTGNGDGTFNGPLSLAIAAADAAVAAADFNSDGVADIALPDGGSAGVPPFVDVFLSGAAASVFPGSPNFGQVDVGAPGQPPLSLVLTSIGDVALSVPSVATTGDYSQINTCTTTLSYEATCQISVTFKPTAPGTRVGTVTITDNSITGPQVVPLTGTGLAPVASLSPATLSFGNQQVGGASAAQNVTLSNTGAAPLAIASITISSNFSQTNNCGSAVAAGGSCTFSVSFTPGILGPITGTLNVADDNNGTNGSIQSVSLSGTGVQPAVGLSTGGLGFGDESLNTTSAAQPVTLTNSGTATVTLSDITATANFAIAAGTTCTPTTALNPGGICLILVTFTPTAAGNLSGALTITDNAPSSPQTVHLTGIGTAPAASLSAPSVNFGGQILGTESGPKTFTFTNTGNQALTIKSINVTGDYIETNTCGPGLAINAVCAFTVFFKPTIGGTRSGAITITDNAGAGVQTVALTGQGEDFTLSAGSSPTSATVAPGGMATYTLTFNPLGGLNQLVQLACTKAPPASTCTVTPASFTPGGTAPTTVTVKVATSVGGLVAPVMRPIPPSPIGKPLLTLLGFLAFIAFAMRRAPNPSGLGRRRMAPVLTTLAMLALLALSMAACGGSGGSGPATPAGTYSLTVTGAVNPGTANLNHSVTLTLTVE